MSPNQEPSARDGVDTDESTTFSREELATQVELLLEDSYRLRVRLERERQQRDTRTAVGFGLLGVVALGSALILPEVRTALLVIGATGLFAALFVAYRGSDSDAGESIEEGVYTAAAANTSGLIEELELRGPEMYVPLGDQADSRDVSAPVRLFVPQRIDYSLPEREAIRSTRLVTGGARSRGLALVPTGGVLLKRFQSARSEPLERELPSGAETLVRALTDHFELVRDARMESSLEDREISVAVSGSRCGTVDRVDHPVSSLLGAGLAVVLDRAVTVDVTSEDERADFIVTCRWESEE